MIRVYIADPNPIIHKGIKAIFRNSNKISIVGKCLRPNELFNFINSKKVDIIILELELPIIASINLIRELRGKNQEVKFLIYSNHGEKRYAINSLKFGASGFLSKRSPVRYLKDAIKKIHSGGIYISKELAGHIALNEAVSNPRAILEKLSEREIQVLSFLVSGKRNKEIASNLRISDKTVSTYRSRIMKKTEAKNLVDLIKKTEHIDLELY